jgi:hypothetical protein
VGRTCLAAPAGPGRVGRSHPATPQGPRWPLLWARSLQTLALGDEGGHTWPLGASVRSVGIPYLSLGLLQCRSGDGPYCLLWGFLWTPVISSAPSDSLPAVGTGDCRICPMPNERRWGGGCRWRCLSCGDLTGGRRATSIERPGAEGPRWRPSAECLAATQQWPA